MGLYLPQRWRRQPTYPLQLVGKWRARIFSAWYANAWQRDIAKPGWVSDLQSSTIVRQADKFFFPGGTAETSYLSYGVPIPGPSDLTKFSSITIATPATLTGRMSLFSTMSNGVSVGMSVNAGYSTSSSAFSYNSSNFTGETPAGFFVTGQRIVVGYTYEKTGNRCLFYKNGTLNYSGSYDAANNVVYGSSAGDLNCVGGRKNTGGATVYQWGGSLELHVMLPEVLSAAEMQSVSENPWQLFAPLPTKRYFFAAGAPPTATGQYFDPLLNNQAWF